MREGLRWRLLIAIFVLMVGVVYALPSIPAIGTSPIKKFLPEEKVSLGLDLQGGIHLVLGVDVDKALSNNLSLMGQDIRTEAREEKIFVLQPRLVQGEKLEFVLLKSSQKEALDALLEKSFNRLDAESTVLDNKKVRYTLTYTPEYKKYVSDLTLDQAVKTIRNRVDQFGVAEPDIRKQQGFRIQVQLPGLTDTERAIKIIGKTAHLEFKMVREGVDPAKAAKGIVPPGTDPVKQMHRNPDGTYSESVIVLNKSAALTGDTISDARVAYDQFNKPYVSISFNSSGARRFEELTGQNVKKRMAIVLDGKVYSAPVIQEKIRGGRASISGSFTTEEAHDLAIVLRAGSLPAPVTILEERSVGPSLGQESIDQGITATLIGGALVMIFMMIYYGFSGVIANCVLLMNIVFIVAGLAAFGATLTLPGIAGIILTLGMAVDANVIIFERIREELRRGLTPFKAVDQGFSSATLTIFDANVTTLLAAIILYQFGSGPIRGFAVTLSLGILASMFTAIFCARIIFGLWINGKPGRKLSI